MHHTIQSLCRAFALATPLLLAAEAHAASPSLSSCGQIFIKAEGECTVYAEGGCEAMCTPVSLNAACAAELRADCDGQCDASASVDCKASCQGGCEAECEVDPGEFDCTAACTADCDADCAGRCNADGNSAECKASCQATCSGHCDAQCTVTPPEADCKARCEASCSGSCDAEANVDCQIDCQADGYATCRADLQGGCEAQCRKPEGAIFCDGQFIDAASVEDCVAAIQAIFKIEVYVDGSAMCEGNTCSAEGEFGCSCTSSASGGDLSLAAIFSLGIAGLALRRRRR